MTTVVDPALFQADTEEQRAWLRSHKDLLTLSSQEVAFLKYLSLKGLYMSMPPIARTIVALVFLLICIIILPLIVVSLVRVYQTRPLELVSAAVLLIATILTWKLWVGTL